MLTRLSIALGLLLFIVGPAMAQYANWKHSASVFILTTPEGVYLPVTASVEGFPLLVRLHKDTFDFRQAKANGDDLRFSAKDGPPLVYQIEEWDAGKGVASIWIRIPKIAGNERQEIRLHWGNADAKSESNGKAVFDDTNGYLSVWHMNETIKDEVGTLESKDTGTVPTPGIVGQARHFPGMKGIAGGEKIANFPVGSAAHSTEGWFRAEKTNTTIIGWGNEAGGRGGKIRMQLRSPPHIHIDSNFSDVDGKVKIPMSEWVHVAHTYNRGEGKIYINGQLDTTATPMLDIKNPARLWIGGWYNNYDFVGDIDEVRISQVTRSAEWIRLQFENQKPLQTLVGSPVQTGNDFSVSQTQVTVAEGKSLTLTAKAGGAQKVSWYATRDGVESLVATDRLAYAFDAGRVGGNQTLSLRFQAVYANEVKSKAIAITIQEAIPEPLFQLQVPATWNARDRIEIVPKITNLDAMQASGAGTLNYVWTVLNIAVAKEVLPGKLVLNRAHNSGTLTVRVAIDNGGKPTVQTATIAVTEPATDSWLIRKPEKDEKPEDGQFYPRDDKNEGTLHYNGTLTEPAEVVLLKLYADDKFIGETPAKPLADMSYSLSLKLSARLCKYKVELVSQRLGVKKVLETVSNIVCGDAYLIDGQSNAEATAFGPADANYQNEWIRSFGSTSSDPKARLTRWGNAVVRSRTGGQFQIGAWGMELAKRLIESQSVPICIINGAVGGSRIDVHQRNHANPTDVTTIYGRILYRIQQARLTHGIRAVLWHQGENDQGSDGPTGGYGYETYQQYFVDMAAAWKSDYPNIQHYYVFQIWPKSCSMGINGSDNRLREVQRNLPKLFSKLSVMSTLGIQPPGGCHFPIEGYAEIAKLIAPLVQRDIYAKKSETSITAPNLLRLYFTSDKQDELGMEFDQPVKWEAKLTSEFTLDGEKGKVAAGSVKGKTLTLKLHAASSAKSLTYLDSASWSQEKLLRGENGIAALTFCEVPILRK